MIKYNYFEVDKEYLLVCKERKFEGKKRMVGTREKISSTSENIFLLIYGIWFFVLTISTTYFEDYLDIKNMRYVVDAFTYIYLLWYLMNTEKNEKDICVKTIAFIVIGVLARYFSGDKYVLPMVCLAVCVKDVDYKKIFKVYIAIALGVLAVTIIASRVGIINTMVSEGDRFRDSLGYGYYTYASEIGLFVALAYIAIRKDITLWELGILGVGNYIIYHFTDTRVPFFAVCIILICRAVTLCLKNVDKIEKIKWSKALRVIIILSPFIFMIFSYLIHFFYNSDSEIWTKLNQWLNTRLELGHAGLLGMPHTLFGQNINWDDWIEPLGYSSYFYVDNAYMYIELRQGIVYMLMVVTGYSCVLKKAVQEKNEGLILAVIGCLIYGLADPELANPKFQPMILLIGWGLSTSTEQNALSSSD